MNQKEIGELRRRFKPERSAISRIYGCYVNTSREVVSLMDESLGRMPPEEAEQYLGLLKKVLSGQPGKNLIDVVFSTQQVADSDEHRLLMNLRESELRDGDVRRELCQKIIDSLDLGDTNYLILLAHDAYDVPYRGKDGEDQADAGDTVFSYFVCCVCPVKDGKPGLGYFPGEGEFHSFAAGQMVSAPEVGFLFPAFDQRAANLYNALYYTRKPEDMHQDFLDAVFHTEPPLSAAEQREAFESALSDALEEGCPMEVAQSVYGRLREKIEEHQETKDPEPLEVSAGELGNILRDCGVPEERADAFQARCSERLGAAVNPANLIDSKKFEVRMDRVTVSVDPEHSGLVSSRVIDGRKYLLIPIDGELELNGMTVDAAGDSAPND